jgi:hypothetical protein
LLKKNGIDLYRMKQTDSFHTKEFKSRLKDLLQKKQGNFVEDYTLSLIEDDGKAHIKVDLRHGNQVFETYSSHRDLCNDIFEYIEGVARYIPLAIPIVIDFLIPPDYESLENKISSEFFTNYNFNFDEKRREAHSVHLKGWLMMGIGILFLLVYLVFVVLEKTNSSNLFWFLGDQIFSIVAWVFIWDATDKWAFEEWGYKRESLREAQLASASVVFTIEKNVSVVKE